jgi:FkbM family methyltransferase
MIPRVIKRTGYQVLGMENFCLAKGLLGIARGFERTYESFVGLLPQGGLLLDVGANIGVSTAFALRKRPDLTVIAFEPIPTNLIAAKRLCRLLRTKDVDFRQVALGDSMGTIEMVMPHVEKIPSSGQTYAVHDDVSEYAVSALGQGGSHFTVPVVTIDSLELPQVHGMKLDVENFEAHVLRGAVQLIKRDHPIIYCELWDTPNRSTVMSLLGELGYTCEKLDTKEDFLFRIDPHKIA